MKRTVALCVVAALSAVLIWQRGTQAEARATLRQDVTHCVTAALPPRERLQTCARLLETPELSNSAQARFHYAMGWAHKDLEQYEDAVAAYSEAMALQTKRIYFSQRPYALLELGRYEEGLADAYSGINGWPDAHDKRHKVMAGNVAWAYKRLKQPENELAALDSYLEIWPDDVKRLTRRIAVTKTLRSTVGLKDEYLMQLRDLTHLFDVEGRTNWNRLRARAEVLAALNLPEPAMRDAVDAYSVLLEHGDPKEPMDEATRTSVVEIKQGAIDALSLTSEALAARVDLNATDWDGVRRRADVQYKRGRLNAAIADMETLILLRPEDESARENLVFMQELQDILSGTNLFRDRATTETGDKALIRSKIGIIAEIWYQCTVSLRGKRGHHMKFRSILAACLIGFVGLAGCETITDIKDAGTFEYEGERYPVKRIEGVDDNGEWYTFAVELPDGRLARCSPKKGQILRNIKDCFPSFGGAIEEFQNPTTSTSEEGGMY